MKLAIIGTGYVGLVTGTCFAEMGNDVACVDIDEAKLEGLRLGRLPIFEPGLEIPFERGVRDGRLRFTSDLADAVPDADVVFLTLPTPPSEDGSADLSHVLEASRSVARHLRGYTVVVSKSTVPVGTTDRIAAIIEESIPSDATFDIASNPEFLREGVALNDFMKPERVIVGTSSQKVIDLLTRLYEPFVRSGNPILVMDTRSSEMSKYAANSFLATKISFMNEIANVCERVGANVDHVRRGIGSDSRIGRQFLYAGLGFGGSCFPKDVTALTKTAESVGYEFEILESVLRVNSRQRGSLTRRVIDYFGADLTGHKVAVWGLAFKPNTDDIREAPAILTIESLLERGASVAAFDPEAMANARARLGDRIEYAPDAYDVVEQAEALVICTEWNEFRRPEFSRLRALMASPTVFDGRNLYNPKEMASLGFHYESIGRPTYEPSLTAADLEEDE